VFPFKTALNASTLFPFALELPQQVEIAAQAGFEGIEIWMKDVEEFVAKGGSLAQLRADISTAGLAVVNAIAFFPWADANPAIREQGFAQAEREIEMLATLGCTAVAAPPYGEVAGMSLEAMAEQYARLAELGRRMGVEPYLEFWGRAKQLARLHEAIYVALSSGVFEPKLLIDPFHMYTGGSHLSNLGALQGHMIGIVHVNDYPANPERTVITDQERLFPGAGIAPSSQLAAYLDAAGYCGYLSLELFVENYGTATALEVALRGKHAVVSTYTIDR
jgi:sugar phosphate isomerase/epimerase